MKRQEEWKKRVARRWRTDRGMKGGELMRRTGNRKGAKSLRKKQGGEREQRKEAVDWKTGEEETYTRKWSKGQQTGRKMKNIKQEQK